MPDLTGEAQATQQLLIQLARNQKQRPALQQDSKRATRSREDTDDTKCRVRVDLDHLIVVCIRYTPSSTTAARVTMASTISTLRATSISARVPRRAATFGR
jgi:hypothetical protein